MYIVFLFGKDWLIIYASYHIGWGGEVNHEEKIYKINRKNDIKEKRLKWLLLKLFFSKIPFLSISYHIILNKTFMIKQNKVFCLNLE